MRVTIWTAGLLLAVLTIAACGSGGANEEDNGRPPGSNGAANVAASCESIGEIKSYRYSISLKLQSPALGQNGTGTPSEPFSAFAEALSALFADMEMEGAYVAPDRSQAILRFLNEEVELRSIGDKSWVRVGATWQDQESSPAQESVLTPRSVCQDIVKELAPSLSDQDSQRETVSGIETDHYRLNEADLNKLSGLLGKGSPSELPQRFAVDLWLARDGRWPVRLQIAASDTDEKGQPIGLQLFMEFRDIGDPNIQIDPPVVSTEGT